MKIRVIVNEGNYATISFLPESEKESQQLDELLKIDTNKEGTNWLYDSAKSEAKGKKFATGTVGCVRVQGRELERFINTGSLSLISRRDTQE